TVAWTPNLQGAKQVERQATGEKVRLFRALCVPQRLHRLEPRRPNGWVNAEEQANARRDRQRHQRDVWREYCLQGLLWSAATNAAKGSERTGDASQHVTGCHANSAA